MTKRKDDRMTVAFHFYECPECGKKGSIGFRTDADEDQTMYMQCEHRVPIVIEGRINREARKAREQAVSALIGVPVAELTPEDFAIYDQTRESVRAHRAARGEPA
jgi:hypothetical protein